MWVRCLFDRIADIPSASARARISSEIHLDQRIDALRSNSVYEVRALELWEDDTWRFYLHPDLTMPWPTPYPSALFSVVDSSIPSGWSCQFLDSAPKRISFSAWAQDDTFYERLVDGDAAARLAYCEAFPTTKV